MGRPPGAAPWHPAVTLAVLGGGIVALYFGQTILIPIALAVLLSFALAPLVSRLRRWGLPRVPAVLLAVLLAFGAIATFGLIVGSQLAQLADNLPSYQENIRAKVRSLQDALPQGGIVEQLSRMLHELGQDLQQVQQQTQQAQDASDTGDRGRLILERPQQEPITVRIQQPAMSPFEVLETVGLPLLAPVGTAGIVIVFAIFMLLEREDLRDRLIRLLGGGNLHQTTEALNEAATRVSRYLLMQLVVNASYGIPVGIGLWLIGVPNALLWGLLATVLRFVPYVGPFIAALFPIVLSVAVDPGWSMLLWTIALFLVLELISNNIIEPWLYGASTGVSTVAILVAAIFWTSLWGAVGLLLSTPLTVCLAVIGRYVPQLAFLDVLLGSEPVLVPSERFYQRMLVGDSEEGEDIADEFLKERPLIAFYEEVMLPALRLAETDRRRKVLVGEGRAVVVNGFLEVVAELADHEDPGPEDEEIAAAAPAMADDGAIVLCIAGRTGLDRVAAAMLAQLLQRRGVATHILPADAVSPERIGTLKLDDARLVCLAYMGPAAVAHARLVCRRLRRIAAQTPILLAFLNGQLDEAKEGEPSRALGADLVAVSLREAVEKAMDRVAADGSIAAASGQGAVA